MSGDLIQSPQSGLLAIPLDVVPEANLVFMKALSGRVEALPRAIQSEDDEKTWADVLNQAHKGYKSLNDRRLALQAEHKEWIEKHINAPAEPWLEKMDALKKLAQAVLEKHADDVAKAKALALAEQEAEKAKARQLAQEAEQRKQVAESAIVSAKTDEQFEQAAQAFDKGVAVDLEANTMLMTSAPLPELGKLRGTKTKDKVKDLVVHDLSKLPIAYHMADTKKIERGILDGVLTDKTEGISFKVVTTYSASGR